MRQCEDCGSTACPLITLITSAHQRGISMFVCKHIKISMFNHQTLIVPTALGLSNVSHQPLHLYELPRNAINIRQYSREEKKEEKKQNKADCVCMCQKQKETDVLLTICYRFKLALHFSRAHTARAQHISFSCAFFTRPPQTRTQTRPRLVAVIEMCACARAQM